MVTFVSSGYVSASLIFLYFDVAVLIATTYYITAHGVDYVAWPRLQPLSDTINYTGKGYSSGRRGRGFASSSTKAFKPLHKQVQKSGHSVDNGREMELAHPAQAPTANTASNASKKRLD